MDLSLADFEVKYYSSIYSLFSVINSNRYSTQAKFIIMLFFF